MSIYSVSWRLQRTTTEYGYVLVPVTEDLIKLDETGIGRMDVERMAQRAIERGHSEVIQWYPEGQQVQLHPLQKAPEPDEKNS